MGCKGTNLGNGAVGWWGRNIYSRIDLEAIPGKIRVLLQDKLLARGKDVYLWTQVYEDSLNALLCSCVKDTTQRSDITCSSCYGTKYIPGYIKFAHETIYLSSISAGTTLTDIKLDTTIKPHRLILDDTKLTGNILSAPISYSNEDEFNWEFKNDLAIIKDTNTTTVEFSTNGTIFYPISQLNDAGKKPIGSGNIYIKITLNRINLDDRGPEFEIIRLRHPKVENPYIKILRPQVTELPTWMTYGLRSEQLNERFWTLPLDFFDSNITPNTPDARILENSFYQRVTGINRYNRYVTTRLSYNEEFGIFSYQSFEQRVSQPEEVYSRLVF